METIKELYGKNVNILKYFREHGDNKDTNSTDAVICSYDYQAGSYTEKYYSDEVQKGIYLYHGELVDLKSGEYTRLAAEKMADVLKKLSFYSVLEVGIGEATTICDILKNLPEKKEAWGIELSASRLLYAQKFSKEKNTELNVAVGDMFRLPFEDNAVDLVYTYYCIEESRGREKEAIEEMLRVSKKYVILVEPTYELGNEETKKRIDEMCYIKNLENTLKEIDAEILEYRLFDIFTYNTNSAITVLKKKKVEAKERENVSYACPACKKKMIKQAGNYFCDECYKVYPVIKDIPMLLEENGILCSKYLDF